MNFFRNTSSIACAPLSSKKTERALQLYFRRVMPAMIGVLVLWFSTALAEPNASPAVKTNEKSASRPAYSVVTQ